MALVGLVPQADEPTLDYALEHMNKSQNDFIQCGERYSAFVGGFRAGKTVAGAAKLILHAQQFPGQYLVGRWNEPALRDTTMRTVLSMLPEAWCVPSGFLKDEGRAKMLNGSELIFRHLDIPDLHKHLRSLNLRGFLWDEASEGPEKTFMMLQGRLSTGDPRIGLISSNPRGRDWMWNRFYNPARKKEWRTKYKGFVGFTTENKNLPDDFAQDLIDSYPEDMVQRFVYASFNDFEEQIYKEFNESSHGYDDEQEHEFFAGSGTPPLTWPVFVGIDIGGVDPWAWTFIAVAPNGMLFMFDEIYQSGILVKDLADEYHRIAEGRDIAGIAYDYENQQAAYELEEYGIAGIPAIKQVKPGILKVAQYMHVDSRLIHPFTKQPGSPRFFIANRCVNTIRDLSVYKWEKDKYGRMTGKPADKDADGPDSLRYNIHTFRPDPTKAAQPKMSDNPALDVASRMYWKRVEDQETKKIEHKKRPFRYAFMH